MCFLYFLYSVTMMLIRGNDLQLRSVTSLIRVVSQLRQPCFVNERRSCVFPASQGNSKNSSKIDNYWNYYWSFRVKIPSSVPFFAKTGIKKGTRFKGSRISITAIPYLSYILFALQDQLCDLPVFSLLPDLNESCILTVKSQQFLMLSSFNDTAVIYYKYLISRFDRCKSVCDYDNGLTL